MQREAVHLSFGWANHVATHFWNAQQSYFEFGDDAPEPLVEHDVSFRAGLGADGLETYSPRALLFDLRQEFGSLRTHSALYGGAEEDAARHAWGGPVIAHPPVEPSWFAKALEEEDRAAAAGAPAPTPTLTPTTTPTPTPTSGRPIRYWSDYSRVFFHPRSLVHVAAPSIDGTAFLHPMGDAQPAFATYEHGAAVAHAMEAAHSVLDDNMRWLAEDSDLLQGMQLATNALDGFSGFSHAYLAGLADEFPRTPRLMFAFAPHTWTDPALRRIAAMNTALTLAHASEAALLVPVRAAGDTGPHVALNWDSAHEAAALLAAHIETATLPTRLRRRDTYAAIVGQLNWRHDTPIAALSGCMPTPLAAPVLAPEDALLAEFLAKRGRRRPQPQPPQQPPPALDLRPVWRSYSFAPPRDAQPYASYSVARDRDALAAQPTLAALERRTPPSAYYANRFAPLAFNIESSFPPVLHGLTRDGRALPGADSAVSSLPMASALEVAPGAIEMLAEARDLVAGVLAARTPLELYGVGIDGAVGGRDGLCEVRERLEGLCDAYGGVPDDDDDGAPGTDEEWVSDGWE